MEHTLNSPNPLIQGPHHQAHKDIYAAYSFVMLNDFIFLLQNFKSFQVNAWIILKTKQLKKKNPHYE